MGKENSSGAANGGENKSIMRRTFYKKKGNGENNVVRPKVEEMKFYLHDSASRKTSESFGRIKEAIVLKIQNSFEETRYISEPVIGKAKKTFSKPETTKSTLGDTAELVAAKWAENEIYLGEWKIGFTIYRKDERNFDEAWVKVYALIWDTYCST